jgi:F-type H+-transporting ATPase subunit b
MLDLDISLLVVSALVGILALILNKLFFKPIGQVIDEREAKFEQESGQVEAMTKEIEEKTQHIEKVLKDTQKESRGIKEKLIQKGEQVREEIVTDARGKSKKTFDTHMQQLDRQLTAAENELEQEIRVFSDKIKEIFVG